MELSRAVPGLRRAGLVALGGIAVLVLSHWGQPSSLGYRPTALSALQGTYNPIAPHRLLDTRATGQIPAGTSIVLQVTGASVPTGGAAILNITVTNPASAGFVSVYPADQAGTPTTSNVNFSAGETIANLAAVQLSSTGAVRIYSSTAVDVIVDAAGSFVGAPPAGGS